jgi:hypothetical protein
LAVFLRCSLGLSSTIYMSVAKEPNSWRKMVLDERFARGLKNSQPTCGETIGTACRRAVNLWKAQIKARKFALRKRYGSL